MPHTRCREKDIGRILDEAALLLADEGFGGIAWLTPIALPILNQSDTDTWGEIYQGLMRLLYDIGFLGVVTSAGYQWTYDLPGLLDSPAHTTTQNTFAVHPAFHATLNIGNE